jgi:hypothetical protein
MRQTMDAKRWEQFKETLSAEFYARFKNPIEHTGRTHCDRKQAVMWVHP